MDELKIPRGLENKILFSTKSNGLQVASKIIKSRVLSYNGHVDVQCNFLDDWADDPIKNRTWVWWYNSLEFVIHLVALFREKQEIEILKIAAQYSLNWWRFFLRNNKNDFEFFFHDQSIARRAEHVAVLYVTLQVEVPDFLELDELRQFIHHQTLLLVDDKYYSKYTNHGIDQVVALKNMALIFNQDQQASAWLRLSISRLKDEFEFAFLGDGVNVENSPGYHYRMIVIFFSEFRKENLEIIKNAIRSKKDIDTDDFLLKVDQAAKLFFDRLPKMLSFLTHITQPNGYYPLLGDTVSMQSKVPALSGEIRDTIEYKNLLYTCTNSSEGVEPTNKSFIFEKAGYASIRDEWKDFENAFHLIFRAGYKSRYHRHDDDGQILLMYGGEHWLVDGGLYKYKESDPDRLYIRSKWAHNVPVISFETGKPYTRLIEPDKSGFRKYNIDENGIVRVDAGMMGYRNYTATRHLLCNPFKKRFFVRDRLVSLQEGPVRQTYSHFHFPIDKNIEITDDGVVVSSTQNDEKLLIRVMKGDQPTSVSLVKGLPHDENQNAFMSKKVGEKIPVHKLRFEWLTKNLDTRIEFVFI